MASDLILEVEPGHGAGSRDQPTPSDNWRRVLVASGPFFVRTVNSTPYDEEEINFGDTLYMDVTY